jgi:hypothetical protein
VCAVEYVAVCIWVRGCMSTHHTVWLHQQQQLSVVLVQQAKRKALTVTIMSSY